jgi:hypothetical protein
MVLRGKLRGRVGSRRDYLRKPLVKASELFLSNSLRFVFDLVNRTGNSFNLRYLISHHSFC